MEISTVKSTFVHFSEVAVMSDHHLDQVQLAGSLSIVVLKVVHQVEEDAETYSLYGKCTLKAIYIYIYIYMVFNGHQS